MTCIVSNRSCFFYNEDKLFKNCILVVKYLLNISLQRFCSVCSKNMKIKLIKTNLYQDIIKYIKCIKFSYWKIFWVIWKKTSGDLVNKLNISSHPRNLPFDLHKSSTRTKCSRGKWENYKMTKFEKIKTFFSELIW